MEIRALPDSSRRNDGCGALWAPTADLHEPQIVAALWTGRGMPDLRARQVLRVDRGGALLFVQEDMLAIQALQQRLDRFDPLPGRRIAQRFTLERMTFGAFDHSGSNRTTRTLPVRYLPRQIASSTNPQPIKIIRTPDATAPQPRTVFSG